MNIREAMYRRVIAGIMLVFAAFLCIEWLFPLKIYAETDNQNLKKVRIGFFPGYGMSQGSSSKQLSGFTYDYFNEIAKYTNMEYEYVPCTFSDGLKMLENGEIDIFGPIQKTESREEIFSFTDMNFGYEYIALYTLSQSNIFYNDFEFFSGMKVGIESNSPYVSIMNEFCEEYDINIDYVTTDAVDIAGDIKSGKYDVFLSGSLLDIDGTKVVEKIGSIPFYYAVNKDNNELLEQLNHALYSISRENFDFSSRLFESYYGSRAIFIPDFTKEEAELINANPELSVAFNTDVAPLHYTDSKTGEISGVVINVLESVSRECGIKFNYSFYDDNPNADILVTVNSDNDAVNSKNSRFTIDFMKSPVVLIQKKGDASVSNAKVAISGLMFPDISSIVDKYPDFQIIKYTDSISSIEAFEKDETDMAIASIYIFNSIIQDGNIKNYIATPTDLEFNIRMKVSERIPQKMVGILNKAITKVQPGEMDSVIFSGIMEYKKENPVLTFIKNNIILIILVIVLIIVLISLYILKSKRNILQKAIHYDSVTGLPSAVKFKEDVSEILKSAEPDEYIILSVDIDKFAYINNLLGYETGNLVLKIIARHLESKISKGTIIARECSDIFLFLCKKEKKNTISFNDDKLIKKLEPTLGIDYPLSFSIGAYVIADTAEEVSYMIDKANRARKQSKKMYNTSYTEYTDKMEQEFLRRRKIHLNMAQGLNKNEFIPYLQAKTDLKTHKIKGAEVLVRWRTSDGYNLSPNEFIPIFETNGFIYQLDLYMFEKTCQILQVWEKNQVPNIPRLSVNISKKTLHTEGLCNSLLQYVSKYKINMCHIELELTESAFAEDKKKTIEIINHLKNVGFIISLDDFGSGYSSFNMLKNIDIDVLKIDKDFLEYSLMNERGTKIIHSIIELAKSLNIETVAEGIETEEQVNLLAGFGCNLAQGFYFAKPLEISAFDMNCFGFTVKC